MDAVGSGGSGVRLKCEREAELVEELYFHNFLNHFLLSQPRFGETPLPPSLEVIFTLVTLVSFSHE